MSSVPLIFFMNKYDKLVKELEHFNEYCRMHANYHRDIELSDTKCELLTVAIVIKEITKMIDRIDTNKEPEYDPERLENVEFFLKHRG